MSKKINIKKIRPMYTAVITTYDVYTEEDVAGVLVDDASMVGQPKPYQFTKAQKWFPSSVLCKGMGLSPQFPKRRRF